MEAIPSGNLLVTCLMIYDSNNSQVKLANLFGVPLNGGILFLTEGSRVRLSSNVTEYKICNL